MDKGDVAMEKGDEDEALKEYSTAKEMCPDNIEMKYWTAVSLANIKRFEEAIPLFKEIFNFDNNWRILTERLPEVNLLNLSKEELDKILTLE
jgi:tetratricopeptide (TPR) repeat protein